MSALPVRIPAAADSETDAVSVDSGYGLEAASAEARVRWAVEKFGDRAILTTSFGIQSAVMLHLVTQVAPRIPVVFIDTGYLFPDTYRFADELTARLKLNLKTYRAPLSPAEQEAKFGRLWEKGAEGLERYNFLNKVEPMDRAVRELGATGWLVGLRRVQASSRQVVQVVQVQNRITKVHPIIDWTDRDVHFYLKQHGLPYHPLFEKNYQSVGDWHSSSPLLPGMTVEETRFNGVKRECGLHEPSGRVDFQI